MSNRNRHPHYRRIGNEFDSLVDGSDFDVVVIGSGYGGSIVASRMARIGKTVCLLERGREIPPGEYPSSLTTAQNELQLRTDAHSTALGKRNGLYDVRVNEDVSVIVGCGLGGTSLINANVSLTADPDILTSGAHAWPVELRTPEAWRPYYDKARRWLNASPYPDEFPKPNKLAALEAAAHGLGIAAYRPPINVTFRDLKDNGHGVPQPQCNRCGDCCSGCNHGAKNTTLMNYLPDAHRHGATIYCNCTVNSIAPGVGSERKRWQVRLAHTVEADRAISVFANAVFICAGTLGSTEILLRSKRRGLSCSDLLGKRFSGNGDVLAFGFNSYWRDNAESVDPTLQPDDAERYEPVYGIGQADNLLDEKMLPGPCITGVVDLRNRSRQMIDRCVVEEGVIPGPFGAVLPMAFFMAAAHRAQFMEYGPAQAESRLKDMQRLAEAMTASGVSMSSACYGGALARTQSYLGMGVDTAAGELRLLDDQSHVVVHWPNAGTSDNAQKLNATISRLNDQVAGHFLANPLWDRAFGHKLVTVHPLGGCAMANDAAQGVVNHACALFSGANGTAVHAGIYVCDGSVVPGALGVNPLLTISAIAERACELLHGAPIPADFTPVEGDPYGPDETNEKDATTLRLAKTRSPQSAAAGAAPGENRTANDTQLLDALAQKLAAHVDLSKVPPEVAVEASGAPRGWMQEIVFPVASIGSVTAMASAATKERKQRGVDAMSSEENRLWNLQYRTVDGVLATHARKFSQWLTFSETMRGYVADAESIESSSTLDGRFRLARRRGQSDGIRSAIRLTFCVRADDVAAAVESGEFTFAITSASRVSCARYWDEEVAIADGELRLLRNEPDTVETWTLEYSARLKAGARTPRFLRGFKTLRGKPHSHWWTDLTTLCVEIFDAESDYVAKRAPRAIGLCSLSLQDFLHQLHSFDYGTKSLLVTWLIRVLSLVAGQDSKDVQKLIARYFGSKVVAELGMTVFRAYGGLLATLRNFPAEDRKRAASTATRLPTPLPVEQRAGEKFRLARYRGGGMPVILGPGMGVTASSFATETVEKNIVEALRERGRDVWLFDYRASADSGYSTEPFTLDDIVRDDWPRAIERVLEISGASQVQIVAHCVASLTLLMSLLSRHTACERIRSIVSSQLTLHPVANWLNNAKADSEVIRALERLPSIVQLGNVVSMNSGATPFERALDVFAAQIPVPDGEECNNPTCRRIFAIYGPSYRHAQLNQATHTAMSSWFREINLKPFEQMAKMMQCGFAVDAEGRNRYLTRRYIDEGANGNRIGGLDLPITFLAGALNLEFLPETSERTFEWLCAHNPLRAADYSRKVFPDYGHMDFFIGRRAHIDIFPYIVSELERHLPAP